MESAPSSTEPRGRHQTSTHLPATTDENLARLADALRELNAFLRVGRLSDDEARALPTRIDALSLSRLEIATW